MSEDYNLSDEDEELFPELKGTLSKWTNYIHGWQDRYIVLKDGTLAYYKSVHDMSLGCRGAISISKATIKPHEFDECRFDVSVHDCVWYLRAPTPEEKTKWVEYLETYKAESGYGSDSNLRRHGSTISITSTTLSSSSLKKGCAELRLKLAEMETYRDILCRQIDTLQSYFDACSETVAALKENEENSIGSALYLHNEMDVDGVNNHYDAVDVVSKCVPHQSINKELLLQHGLHAVDFKGEAITFRETTAGIFSTMSHCMELMGAWEDKWRRRLEADRRLRAELAEKQAQLSEKEKRVVVCTM